MVIAAAAGGIWSDDASTPGLRADYSAALLPFWHYNCGLGEGSVALASWLTLVLSQLLLIGAARASHPSARCPRLSGSPEAGLIFFIVRSTNYAWDYAVTVSFVHFILTCLCTLAFPTNWRCQPYPTHVRAHARCNTGAPALLYGRRDESRCVLQLVGHAHRVDGCRRPLVHLRDLPAARPPRHREVSHVTTHGEGEEGRGGGGSRRNDRVRVVRG
jgi:hypothetical protein